jgi:hypothetical protein
LWVHAARIFTTAIIGVGLNAVVTSIKISASKENFIVIGAFF